MFFHYFTTLYIFDIFASSLQVGPSWLLSLDQRETQPLMVVFTKDQSRVFPDPGDDGCWSSDPGDDGCWSLITPWNNQPKVIPQYFTKKAYQGNEAFKTGSSFKISMYWYHCYISVVVFATITRLNKNIQCLVWRWDIFWHGCDREKMPPPIFQRCFYQLNVSKLGVWYRWYEVLMQKSFRILRKETQASISSQTSSSCI